MKANNNIRFEYFPLTDTIRLMPYNYLCLSAYNSNMFDLRGFDGAIDLELLQKVLTVVYRGGNRFRDGETLVNILNKECFNKKIKIQDVFDHMLKNKLVLLSNAKRKELNILKKDEVVIHSIESDELISVYSNLKDEVIYFLTIDDIELLEDVKKEEIVIIPPLKESTKQLLKEALGK